MSRFTLHQGDCREVMATLAESSVDAIVCDPPYDLTGARPGGRSPATEGKVMKGFMGMAWDATGVAFDPATWLAAMRVLKPGGYLLAFSGTRTYHRMVCAIEDAGFEVRDQMMWIYGSGFPKSHNGEWGGTALKPAHEPIVVARKPLTGTVEANWRAWGTGALNIDACRVPTEDDTGNGVKTSQAAAGYDGGWKTMRTEGSPLGRWPANIIHDGSDEVLAAFPESDGSGSARVLRRSAKTAPDGWGMNTRCADAATVEDAGKGSAARFFKECKFSEDDQWPHPSNSGLRARSATSPSSSCGIPTAAEAAATKTLDSKSEESPVTPAYTASCESCTPRPSHVSAAALESIATIPTTASHSKSNGCAHPATAESIKAAKWAAEVDANVLAKGTRFHYCPKASKEDRNEGCNGLPVKTGGMVSNTSGQHITRRDGGAPGPTANHHPTVKPTDLMAYLCRLVTPPHGVILDPFMGSGSTGKAAVLEGFDFIGIDLSDEYIAIARARIEFALRQGHQPSFSFEAEEPPQQNEVGNDQHTTESVGVERAVVD